MSYYIVIGLNNVVGLLIVQRFYYYIFERRDMNKWKRAIMQILVLLASIGINVLFDRIGVALFSGFTIFLLLALLFYKGRIHIKIIATVFIVVFSFITELVTAIIFSAFFGDIIMEIKHNYVLLFLGGVISRIILIALIEVVIRFRNRNTSKVSLNSWVFVVSIPVVSLVMLLTSVYEPIIKNEYSDISTIATISIIYINIVAFYLFDNIVIQIHENNQYKFREEQMLIQKSQYETIIDGYKKVKKVRHDMNGHFVLIEGYLADGKHQKAREYLKKIYKQIRFEKNGLFTGNVAIDALVNNKMAIAKSEMIEFDIDVRLSFSVNIDDMDLCIILGNLLSNAIESCRRVSENKYVQLKIRNRNNVLVISLRNSFDKSNLIFKDGKYMSSKVFRRQGEFGTGLSNIEATIDLYGGNMQILQDDNMFVTNIIIPDKLVGD